MARPGSLYPLGYLLALSPPALFVGGLAMHWPYLLFVVLFGIAPLTRALLGNIPEEPGEWPEWVTTWLDRLPMLASAVYVLALGSVLVMVHRLPPSSLGDWVGLGLSLWTCLFCAIPVAHELIHRRGFERAVGNALAGVTGYPELEGEHIRHHSVSGVVELPEWPRLNDSMWSYVWRRIPHAMHSAWQHHLTLRRSRTHRSHLYLGLTVMAATAGLFALAAGAAGVALYLLVALGVRFTVHAVNFMQHWGLGSDNVEDGSDRRYGWECRCVLQGWMMLNIALHHSHHQHSTAPYYRLVPAASSPRLPAGYALLLIIGMVPPLWRKLMVPALAVWKENPAHQIEPGGLRIICISLPRERQPA